MMGKMLSVVTPIVPFCMMICIFNCFVIVIMMSLFIQIACQFVVFDQIFSCFLSCRSNDLISLFIKSQNLIQANQHQVFLVMHRSVLCARSPHVIEDIGCMAACEIGLKMRHFLS